MNQIIPFLQSWLQNPATMTIAGAVVTKHVLDAVHNAAAKFLPGTRFAALADNTTVIHGSALVLSLAGFAGAALVAHVPVQNVIHLAFMSAAGAVGYNETVANLRTILFPKAADIKGEIKQ